MEGFKVFQITEIERGIMILPKLLRIQFKKQITLLGFRKAKPKSSGNANIRSECTP